MSALFVLSIPNFTLSADIRKVNAVGRSAIIEQKTQTARRNALEDALYLAALEAGGNISGLSITENGNLLREIIKLDTDAGLVDFNILKERNRGTHYELSIEAYFAKKIANNCENPRYPTLSILSPELHVDANVDFRYENVSHKLANLLHEKIELNYKGSVIDASNFTLSMLTRSVQQNRLLDYSYLQNKHSKNSNLPRKSLVNSTIRSKLKGNKILHEVILSLHHSLDDTDYIKTADVMETNLPVKTPVRLLNILQSDEVKLDDTKLDAIVFEFINEILEGACKPLEAKIVNQAGSLILPLGANAGIKKGSLAYVVSGKDSWRILEVTSVFENSSELQPINSVGNSKSLANQTVRLIERSL